MAKRQRKLIDEEENEEEKVEVKNKWDKEAEQWQGNSSADYGKIQTTVSYDNEEYVHMKKLMDRIDVIFEKSRWTIINPSKKIPKDLIPLIFQDILKELESSEFTIVEKFVGICDYTGINYNKAYDSIHIKYQEMIVEEMDEKYQIIEKKGIKKIF